MPDYCLSCCSAVDLTPKQMEQRNIHYVCFQYTVDEEVYADDMGVSMSSEELFERMAHGEKQKPHRSVSHDTSNTLSRF